MVIATATIITLLSVHLSVDLQCVFAGYNARFIPKNGFCDEGFQVYYNETQDKHVTITLATKPGATRNCTCELIPCDAKGAFNASIDYDSDTNVLSLGRERYTGSSAGLTKMTITYSKPNSKSKPTLILYKDGIMYTELKMATDRTKLFVESGKDLYPQIFHCQTHHFIINMTIFISSVQNEKSKYQASLGSRHNLVRVVTN